jgi:hypothetical protein
MLRMKYIGQTTEYNIDFKRISDSVVQILGDIPIETNGFQLSREEKEDWSKMDYTNYRTVYREVENGVQFSCDGSIFIPPTPTVSFNTNGGGTLDGEVKQEVWKYEDLVIPTPIANENYEFSYWSPEIPENGKIESNKTFTAIFTSTLPPEPEPEPSSDLESRVLTLEEDIKKINSALGGE